MTNEELVLRLNKLFPDFNINITEYGSIWGSRQTPSRKVRHRKDWYILSSRNLFISNFMYPLEADKAFRYAIIYTTTEFKQYRCRTWQDIEMFKGYVSGKNNEEIYAKIAEQFTKICEEF